MPIRAIRSDAASPAAADTQDVTSSVVEILPSVAAPARPAGSAPRDPSRPSRIRAVPPSLVEAPPLAIPPNRNPDGSYIVGKNKPPVEKRFKPGVSGNPKGRPKGAKGLKTLTVEVFSEKTLVKTASGDRKMTAPEFGLHKLRELMGKNNLSAILGVLDRWQRAVPDIADDAQATDSAAIPTPMSETDRAILELFADEVRQADRSSPKNR